MEDVIVVVVIVFGIFFFGWLLPSIIGASTNTRIVGRFGSPRGNPEVIQDAAKKIVEKIRGPKKFTIEEVEKVVELQKQIEQREKYFLHNKTQFRNGEISDFEFSLAKKAFEESILEIKKEIAQIMSD